MRAVILAIPLAGSEWCLHVLLVVTPREFSEVDFGLPRHVNDDVA